MSLKIFSDRNNIPGDLGGRPLVYPSILLPFWKQSSEISPTYADYARGARSYLEMTSLEDADICILPINWEVVRGTKLLGKPVKKTQKFAVQFAEEIRRQNKQLAIFFQYTCANQPIAINDAIVFRTSLYNSSRRSNDFSLPLFTGDIVEQQLNGQLILREKSDLPVIGFCGRARNLDELATKSFFYKVWMRLDDRLEESPFKGDELRTNALTYLSKNRFLETNFIKRDRFVTIGQKDEALKEYYYAEYIQNMLHSDYIVCCRGAANSSFRLFETLCMGRIPVFINSDCVLPYDFLIDWKDYCVWVDESELSQIGDIIQDFHGRLSNQDFKDLQLKCRELWKKWLSAEGFYRNFYRHFEDPKTLES